MYELLNNVIDYICIANNTNEQIQQLLHIGFTEKELVQDFSFSQKDIDNYLSENEN